MNEVQCIQRSRLPRHLEERLGMGIPMFRTYSSSSAINSVYSVKQGSSVELTLRFTIETCITQSIAIDVVSNVRVLFVVFCKTVSAERTNSGLETMCVIIWLVFGYQICCWSRPVE